MPSFEAKGEIIHIADLHVISEKFQKREFVLKFEEQYPQEVMFQLVQGNCELLDQFKVGDFVKITADVRGRKWQKTPQDAPRWFNTLQAYKIEMESAAIVETVEDMPAIEPTEMGESDVLPF